jgi:L-alanine-DL-glutamate epimerase-like enolase superfamily enzyme
MPSKAASFQKVNDMKLTDLDIIVTAPPAPGWGGRYWILVKLTTACGIVGWGECYASSVGPVAMTAVIEDVFDRHMRGEDPANVELMFRRTYSAGFTQRPDLTVMGAFSGLEIACWDILGKARDCPVHALLGGQVNRQVRAYTYLYPSTIHPLPDFWINPDMAAESAAACVAAGYTAVKFDPAGPYTIRAGHQPSMSDITRSVEFCAKIREAVGDKADLLFGTHGQFSTGGAIRMAQAIEPYSPLWFEEPIPPDNPHEMAKVASATSIPVATGERLTTRADFAQVLRGGAATILQPALGRAGGIWEARKIAVLAEAYNAQMAPHLYAGPIEWAANIQLAAAIPNLLMAETIETDFHFALVKNTLSVEGGYIPIPTAPGLGIEVDEDLARAHPYTGDGLHLQMTQDPVSYHAANVFAGGAPVKM